MLFSGLAWHLNRQVTQHFQKSAYQYKVDIEEVTRGDPGRFRTLRISRHFIALVTISLILLFHSRVLHNVSPSTVLLEEYLRRDLSRY